MASNIDFEMYEVLKRDDIIKYCSDKQTEQLLNIVETIMTGRVKDGKPMSNQYYVVNTNEQWSNEVESVIKKHI